MTSLDTSTAPHKILFIDEPFAEQERLRQQRSAFLWSVLSLAFDADLLLLKSQVYLEKPVPSHEGYDRLYSLSLESERMLLPDSYHKLAAGQAERFATILDSKRYELVILAGLACLPLGRMIHRVLPDCRVVLDVEKVHISQVQEAWESNKNFDNYQALWTLLRNRAADRFFHSRKNLFLFHDPASQAELTDSFKIPEAAGCLLPLPESQTSESEVSTSDSGANFLLFWGDPRYSENLAVARKLVSELYPRISKKLVEKNITLVLCGDDKLQELCGGRIVHAPIIDLPALIRQALLVLLPLPKPDRELRILRCAFCSKAVVCSPAAVQGIGVSGDSVFVESSPEAMIERISSLLRSRAVLETTGKLLAQFYQQEYAREILEKRLVEKLRIWIEK